MNNRQLHIRKFDEGISNQHQDLHPVFRRVLAARGVNSPQQTDYAIVNLLAPEKIRHLFDAAHLLAECIQKQASILVFGDYDADGATSTALCIKALNLMGFRQVAYLMPDRFIDGYGLSLSVAEKIAGNPPACVITVDNGISSIDGIALLRRHDIDVVVTDHHLPAAELPDASVIVNQNAWGDETEGRNLAGVGVAFYLMLALRGRLRELGWFNPQRPEPNLSVCLDLVAIGTVADLVVLDYHNRLLVNEGLRRIRANACSAGLKALIQVSDRYLDNFSSSDIAFSVAPRINAAGRLEDMTTGVQCLLAEDESTAMLLANELNIINTQRKEIQQQMAAQASQQLKQLDQPSLGKQHSIVLYQADWHEGIVGIVASKLKEKYHRPCIVFAQAENGELKGSGRSIAGIHLRDMLDLVDKRVPGAIIKFGGHAMAAGLSLQPEAMAEFSDCFEQVISEFIDPACFQDSIEYDGALHSELLTLDFAEQLQNLSPWGQGFPMPSFIDEFEVLNQRVLGEKHLKLTVCAGEEGNETVVDAIAFFQPVAVLEQTYDRIRLHYELNINRFRNVDSLQLLVRDVL